MRSARAGTVAVLLLATVVCLVLGGAADDQRKKTVEDYQREHQAAVESASEAEREQYFKYTEELAAMVKGKKMQLDTSQSIRWRSMAEIRKLQNEGRKLIVVRVEPLEGQGRRMEVLAAELRARGAGLDAVWVKRSSLDDDPVWLRWEQIPKTADLFVLHTDHKQPAVVYQGRETFTDQLTWLLEHLKTQRPRPIGSAQELKEFMISAPVSVIAYVPLELGEDGAFLAFIKKIADRHPYLPVGLIYPAEKLPYTEHELTPFTIYYRDEDHVFSLDEDRLQEMDDFTRDNALKRASHQFISRFPQDAAQIFAQGIDKIVFVFDRRPPDQRGLTPTHLRQLALEMRQRVVIAVIAVSDTSMNGVRGFFDVKVEPSVRAFDARTGRQFWPARQQGPQMPHELERFVRDFAADRLKPHRAMERLRVGPDDAKKALVKLNTETYEELLASNNTAAQYTLVLFLADWCKHSRRLYPEYARAAELSRHGEGKGLQVAFAAINLERNDVAPTTKIESFPTIILFNKPGKKETVYRGRREARALLHWLHEEITWTETRVAERDNPPDEGAKDYESPLKKKIKHDKEQRITLEELTLLDPNRKNKNKGAKKGTIAPSPATSDSTPARDEDGKKVEEEIAAGPTVIADSPQLQQDEAADEEEEEESADMGTEKKDTVAPVEPSANTNVEDTVTAKTTVTIDEKTLRKTNVENAKYEL